MGRTRTTYNKEFKMMAVNLCHSGKTATQVAMELGIRSELVSRWKREYEKNKEGSFSGHGKPVMTDSEKEIARLKKELKEVQKERDILKKAMNIFSRSDSKNTNSQKGIRRNLLLKRCVRCWVLGKVAFMNG